MDNLIVVVDSPDDWIPYFPTDQLIPVKDYLFKKVFQDNKSMKVINLCHHYKYLSQGYYCSLLAEARGHKVIPSLKTINDVSKKSLYIDDLDEFTKATNSIDKKSLDLKGNDKNFVFRIFFGRTTLNDFQDLATQIFQYYPFPLLEVKLVYKDEWQIKSLGPIGLRDLDEEEETIFAESLDQYSIKLWRSPKSKKAYIYDLAVLSSTDEALCPSNEKALKKFLKACERNKVYCEFITKKDASRINEFDALFIRETTTVSNHTYKISKIAEGEGLAVIDDPQSILKCTNKIYVTNLLDRNGIQTIPGRFVSDAKERTLVQLIKEFGFPMVVKIPDGSFSTGVKKTQEKAELKSTLELMLKKSDLVLVQRFLYTSFDWRVGVLDKSPLFVCKYFMSKNNWQIYNHSLGKKNKDFYGACQCLDVSDTPKKVIDVAVKAASLIGNGLYGVDLKEDDDGNVYVVEINDNPNIDAGVEDKILGDKIYDILVKWFIKEIELRKKPQSV